MSPERPAAGAVPRAPAAVAHGARNRGDQGRGETGGKKVGRGSRIARIVKAEAEGIRHPSALAGVVGKDEGTEVLSIHRGKCMRRSRVRDLGRAGLKGNL